MENPEEYKPGQSIDVGIFKDANRIRVMGRTKGKGFQGHVQRWGVKLLHRKNRKHRRMVGTLGPWHPSYVRSTVPQAGQMGFQKRTELNKRILKIEDNFELKGGIVNFGNVKSECLLIEGSLPGPKKRLIRIRKTIRPIASYLVKSPDITFISRESHQRK